MRGKIDLVIYDMDGLLIDSEPYWRAAEIKVFGSVGLSLSEQDCIETTGFRFDEVIEHWWNKKQWTGKTKQEIHDEVLDEMEHAIIHQAEGMNGIRESLHYFKERNVKIALASSSAMRLIKTTVNKLKIEKYFELLVSAEHETYGKPHPAVFLRTAETLRVLPENCLVIEDSYNGVIAAKAARMNCLVVPAANDFENKKWIIADRKLKSLHEIPSANLF